jgi:hypothetical protein
MAEEKKEAWLNYLALTTIIFAVCATLSTFKGGSYSTRSVMSQSKAANQWAYYQAKSVKQYMFEMQKDALDLQTKSMDQKKQDVINIYNKKIDDYSRQIQKYESEKEKIRAEAKGFEDIRDESQKHSSAFGIAVIFLQISILLSSVSALLKKKVVWVIGSILGVAGVICFIDGFILFLPL